MKILILTPDIYPYSNGYGGRITLLLHDSFKNSGNDVDLISSVPDNIKSDSSIKKYKIKLLKLYHINKSTYAYFMPLHFKDFLFLRRYLRKNIKDYDLIIINDFAWSLIFASLLLIENKDKNRVMMINHGILYMRNNKYAFYLSKIFNKVLGNIFLQNIRCVVSFSKTTDNDLSDLFKFNIKKTVIPSCLDSKLIVETYEKSIKNIDNILNKYKNDFNIDNFIFSISEISYHKGYHILLEACGILLNRNYDFDVVIAGKTNDDYMPILYKIINKYDMKKKVHFIGQIDDVEKFALMMKSKVYVIPSLTEGFGVGAEEAMLLGVKTIATDTGAHKDLLGDIDYNIIVKPGDIDELSDAIIKSLGFEKIKPELNYKKLCDLSCEKIAREILNFFNS